MTRVFIYTELYIIAKNIHLSYCNLFLSINLIQIRSANFKNKVLVSIPFIRKYAPSLFICTLRRCSASCLNAPNTGLSKIMCTTVWSWAGSQIHNRLARLLKPFQVFQVLGEPPPPMSRLRLRDKPWARIFCDN